MSVTETNPYGVLGVKTRASEREIQEAYRELAQRYHPSLNPGDARAAQAFREVSHAYRLLSDKEERARFDRENAAAGGTTAKPERAARYVPTRMRENVDGVYQSYFDSESGREIKRLRPWAVMAIAVMMFLSFMVPLLRGAAVQLDGSVVSSRYAGLSIERYLMIWTWPLQRFIFQPWDLFRGGALRPPPYSLTWTILGSDGALHEFTPGARCTLLSDQLLTPGMSIHKPAWSLEYEINGQSASDFAPSCAVFFPLWLVISFSLFTMGIMDWAVNRSRLR